MANSEKSLPFDRRRFLQCSAMAAATLGGSLLTRGWWKPSGAGLLQGASQLDDVGPGDGIEQPNVLFIAIDDLNDWVGHLGGHPNACTPNIDRLAAQGVTFTNAFCSAPGCNPSRVSLFTGIRPSTSGVYTNLQKRSNRVVAQ